MEDDESIASLISIMAEKGGYTFVGKTGSGEEPIIRAANREPDLIVIDNSLANIMNSVRAARFIIRFFQEPIFFLTAFCHDLLPERTRNVNPPE